jgi:hypothetical protein
MANAEMNDFIFVFDAHGRPHKAIGTPYESEDILQSLIASYPELLLSGDTLETETTRWMVITREAGIPDGEDRGDRWALDHLLLDQEGTPTFVEVKRASDTRLRREVVGQMLDYAANAAHYWPAGRVRALAENHYQSKGGATNAVLELLGLTSDGDHDDTLESFWHRVDQNLRNGRVRLLFVADQLPGELRRVIEFLNDKMQDVEVLGVELRQYTTLEFRAVVPRLVGQTETARTTKR